jgi:hypothetical protein
MNSTKKFILSTLVTINCLSNMGPQGFGSYINEYFVETGTFGGDSIIKALSVGFNNIRSIELDKKLYIGAVAGFKNKNNVSIVHGDSSKILWQTIKDIDTTITFWLDAHSCPPNEDGSPNCPLIEELNQIKNHPIKNHTILIDDMHCAGTILFDGLTKEDLIKKIKEINPEYTITYVPGGNDGEYPENVMVAIVK